MPANPKNTYLPALQQGTLTVEGEFVWGSNYTFLTQVTYNESTFPAVYKPARGTRPLWDFPPESLPRREVAAFLVSEALGWHFVPPTTFRQDGPFGAGSLQLFIEHDPDYHYFNFEDNDRQRLRPVVLFDIIVNNADRKGSHVLVDQDNHMWLIDHGISFHRDDKLRTVIWDFAGETFPEDLCQSLNRFEAQMESESEFLEQLSLCLSAREINALADRARRLMATRRYPNPHPNRRPYPWPPI